MHDTHFKNLIQINVTLEPLPTLPGSDIYCNSSDRKVDFK